MSAPQAPASAPDRPFADEIDLRWMRAALALGRRGLGSAWPNPAVGCVIVDRRAPGDGRLIARGWTQAGGRPHAEEMAIAAAARIAPELTRGACAYVTLEPCAHIGRAPPCAAALAAAGVGRVLYAVEDPDPRVCGRGRAALEASGVTVVANVCAAEAREDLAGHILRQTEGRPHLTLKLAGALDGRIATASGESRWISGEAARARAHLLRVEADAILVGSGTALADDPRLDVRLPGLEAASPVRVVADSGASLALDGWLARSAGWRPLWVLHAEDAPAARLAALRAIGVETFPTPRDANGRLDLRAAFGALAARGVTRVLCEGGGRLAAGLVAADLVDRLVWATAGVAIGAEGAAAFGPLGLSRLADAPRFTLKRLERVGGDVWTEWRRERRERV